MGNKSAYLGFVIALSLVAFCTPGAAAMNSYFVATYDVSIPVAETKDYIDDVSWLGVSLEWSKPWRRDYPINIGLRLGWQVFEQRVTETMVLEGAAVTGTQRRYINSFPIVAFGRYYFGEERALRAYGGAGLGVFYTMQRFEIGVAAFEEKNWHFGLVPEIGVQMPVGNLEAVANLRYNYAFKSGKSIAGDGIPYAYLSVGLGLVYSYW